ncbi:lipoprotein A family protein [Luminiphilus syltensis NOR5-1B]|uniref:Lipoprotein A family protein n=1 Tax=Luminiphilus syltensis NOR5-1B TaxID=565045 RepID=B8KRQ1_9GAMM|nr:lipoprotein A family protein [Luminiphilus syltensis NOR5-1B]
MNDRGPFIDGRIVDLTRAAFSSIADTSKGVVPVTIEAIP